MFGDGILEVMRKTAEPKENDVSKIIYGTCNIDANNILTIKTDIMGGTLDTNFLTGDLSFLSDGDRVQLLRHSRGQRFHIIPTTEQVKRALKDELDKKADKVINATMDNFAKLSSTGNLQDSGEKTGSFLYSSDKGEIEDRALGIGATFKVLQTTSSGTVNERNLTLPTGGGGSGGGGYLFPHRTVAPANFINPETGVNYTAEDVDILLPQNHVPADFFTTNPPKVNYYFLGGTEGTDSVYSLSESNITYNLNGSSVRFNQSKAYAPVMWRRNISITGRTITFTNGEFADGVRLAFSSGSTGSMSVNFSDTKLNNIDTLYISNATTTFGAVAFIDTMYMPTAGYTSAVINAKRPVVVKMLIGQTNGTAGSATVNCVDIYSFFAVLSKRDAVIDLVKGTNPNFIFLPWQQSATEEVLETEVTEVQEQVTEQAETIENLQEQTEIITTNKADKVAGAVANNIAILTQDGNLADGGKSISNILDEGLPYTTTAPTSANSNGKLKIVYLQAAPSTYYDGYIYFIKE